MSQNDSPGGSKRFLFFSLDVFVVQNNKKRTNLEISERKWNFWLLAFFCLGVIKFFIDEYYP